VLCWEDLEVTGPTATWVREALQSTYSTDYLRKQSAGLFRSQAPQDDVDCEALAGKSLRLDGEEWEVTEADASSALLSMRGYAKGFFNMALFSSLVRSHSPNFPKPPKTFQSGWSYLV
jgi:hypothetical protein